LVFLTGLAMASAHGKIARLSRSPVYYVDERLKVQRSLQSKSIPSLDERRREFGYCVPPRGRERV
jgi:hypothetical protein